MGNAQEKTINNPGSDMFNNPDVLKCPFFLLKYMLKNVMIVITQKESKTCAVCPFYFHRNPFIHKDS